MGVLVAAVAEMIAEVSRALPAALTSGGKLIAAYARANHPYENRTFRLQRHTQWQFTDGNLYRGYRVEVHGGMPYGSFVEDGTSRSRPYPYLWPAWQREQATVVQVIEASMVGAVNTVNIQGKV